MAGKKITKPNVTRGKIFDKLAEAFGESVLGMYENKLRVEWIDEDTGEIMQFSLAPVIHKSLVDEEECDKLVSISEQMKIYEAAKAEKESETSTKKTSTKSNTKNKKESVNESDATPVTPIVPVELSEEEKAKLNDLQAMLASNAEF